jgi:hypothetical protein
VFLLWETREVVLFGVLESSRTTEGFVDEMLNFKEYVRYDTESGLLSFKNRCLFDGGRVR